MKVTIRVLLLEFLWCALVCGVATAQNCPSSSILLNAFDKDLNLLQDLRLENLRVEINGNPAQIFSLSLDAHPRHLVLMVDISASMERSAKKRGWGVALPAAIYAVNTIPPDALAAFVTFSDTLHRESNDFGSQANVYARVLDLKNRQPHGQTALFDSVNQVLAEFKDLHFGDAVYLVTDGGDKKARFPRERWKPSW